MQITCYSNFAKRNNSTKQPTGGTVKTVVLKQPTSVLNPTFILNGTDTSYNYIKWGNRYYFVDDARILSNEHTEYICSTDVLATYKDVIGTSSQYVVRSSAASNGNIVDNRYPTTAKPTGQRILLSNLQVPISSTGTYVIGVKTGDSNTGIKYYALNEANFEALTSFMFSDSWFTAQDITFELQKMLCNPMDYISSCYWYPFDLVGSVAGVLINFGYWQCNNARGVRIFEAGRIREWYHSQDLPTHPQSARGDYLNGAPYTQMYVDVFGFGRLPIDPNIFINNRSCTVNVAVDLYTGTGELTVECGNFRALRSSVMFGVPIQLSQSTQDLIKPLYNTVSGAAQFAVGKYLGAAASIGNAVLSTVPQIQTSGSFGSKMAFNELPELDIIWYPIVDEDNATLGRPLCEIRQISTLSGYMECANVDVASVGTKSEKDAIVRFMEGGFFYE